ncbi:hypothetical protein Barb4_05280 [Bacteroidales bacterium Barb4]|nr:hypothetical protein Barb4_05280 [Bacteroidales bacterium Barb4]
MDTIFTNASIEHCNLGKCIITGCKFDSTEFRHTNFVDLQFSNCTLSRVKIDWCHFRKVVFINTIFKNVVFRITEAKKIIFTKCKMDQLTYNFLIACKAKLTDVEIIK